MIKVIWDLKSIREVINYNFYVFFNVFLREFLSVNFVDNVFYIIEVLKVDFIFLGIEIIELVVMVDF